MKILLTGAAGFIGSCYLWKLNSLGIDGAWIVDTDAAAAESRNLGGKKFRDYLTRDAAVAALDKGQLKEIDAVVHLGACADTTEKDLAYLRRNNLEYSQTLCRWALANGKRFHYASSAAVYGDGKNGYSDDDDNTRRSHALNPYGESKLLFDQWLLNEKIADRVVGFRYFNVFGPNEYHKGEMRSMVCKAFDQLEATGRVKLFASTRPNYEDGSEERDFIYVKDVLEVMAFFLDKPQTGGIFNVGTGKARKFIDLVNAVFAALEKPSTIDFIPMPEVLRGQYQYFTQAVTSKLQKVGYIRPFTELETAIQDYVVGYLAKSRKTL